MRKHDRDIFFKLVRGKVLFNELLSRHTSFKIGGPAEIWIEPADVIELRLILTYARMNSHPVFIIGNGSNLLVSDNGVTGFVLKLSAHEFKKIEVVNETVVVGGAVQLSHLIEKMCSLGLSGLEPFVGIPGSIGGSVFMNVGAWDAQFGDYVQSATIMQSDGSIVNLDKDELGFEYRTCKGIETGIVLDVVLDLAKASKEEIEKRFKKYSDARTDSQPKGSSAGCVFKNNNEIPTGRLIDKLGLKGTRIGGAVVSDTHANFIVNDNQATARDVVHLMKKIKARVLEVEGIHLEPEIKFIGEGNYAAF